MSDTPDKSTVDQLTDACMKLGRELAIAQVREQELLQEMAGMIQVRKYEVDHYKTELFKLQAQLDKLGADFAAVCRANSELADAAVDQARAAFEELDAYPNLSAILNNTISGKFSEWPMVAPELRRYAASVGAWRGELGDWRELAEAFYALPLPEQMRQKKLWPNKWNKDTAVIALCLHQLAESTPPPPTAPPPAAP